MNKKPTVLLAEDEADDVFMMARTILKMKVPMALQVAKNGEEAIEKRYLFRAGLKSPLWVEQASGRCDGSTHRQAVFPLCWQVRSALFHDDLPSLEDILKLVES